MDIWQVLHKINQPIVDFNQLSVALDGYSYPRKKVAKFISRGDLIQIKKGLYIFNQDLSPPGFAIETLANLLYGPSYISLKYALAYYGIIPERVSTVTSVTSKRDKDYATPVGNFSYRRLKGRAYSVGIIRKEHEQNNIYLIASPEKALCDFIALDKYIPVVNTVTELLEFMFADMRFDEQEIKKIDKVELYSISQHYKSRKLKAFVSEFLQWSC